jgi:hypothetical protein
MAHAEMGGRYSRATAASTREPTFCYIGFRVFHKIDRGQSIGESPLVSSGKELSAASQSHPISQSIMENSLIAWTLEILQQIGNQGSIRIRESSRE